MKKLKLFEEFNEETESNSGLMSVPPDFEDRMKNLAANAKQKAEIYKVPINEIRIDLFYALKYAIRTFVQNYKNNRTKDKYEYFINYEIDGLLEFKFSKYLDNWQEVKDILWKYINERIPYDEVDFLYDYHLEEKLLKLLIDFLAEIKDENLLII